MSFLGRIRRLEAKHGTSTGTLEYLEGDIPYWVRTGQMRFKYVRVGDEQAAANELQKWERIIAGRLKAVAALED